jgi:hypothetical protein
LKRGPKPFQLGDFARCGHQLTESNVVIQNKRNGGRRLRCRLCRLFQSARSRSKPENAKKNNERAKRWYWRNRDTGRPQQTRREYYESHRAERQAYNRRWRLSHQELIKLYNKRPRSSESVARSKAFWRSHVKDLGDAYVAQLLGVERCLVPANLIEAKRELLRVKRLLKEIT